MTTATLKGGLETILSQFEQKKYGVNVSNSGELVVDFDDGPQISTSVIDKDYFIKEWYTPAQLEVISQFEDLTQRILKESGPRRYSGLWAYSHIDRILETAFNLAGQNGVRLDFVTLLAIMGHENIEDDPEVRTKYREWKLAFGEGNVGEIEKIDAELKGLRDKKKDDLGKQLSLYILASSADTRERGELRSDTATAVRIMDQVTRFQEERPYMGSMGFQYRRVSNEKPINMLRRAIVKNCDFICNFLERGLLYSPHTMRQINKAFKDASEVLILYNGDYHKVTEKRGIGDLLKDRLGEFRNYGVDMPTSVMVLNAFNSLFPLHYLNTTLNDYGDSIKEPDESGKLSLVKASKTQMVENVCELLDTAISIYESDKMILREKERIDSKVEGLKDTRYFYEITWGGDVFEWIKNELLGRQYVESLDKSPKTKVKVYEFARYLREVIGMFDKFYEINGEGVNGKPNLLEKTNTPFDPKVHRNFTFGNVEITVERLMQDYQTLLVRLGVGQPT